ncbi:MAG TPA: response regulator transcription factor [bacterium]|nr:response regulator transcription factor [bacterium]HPR87700.1 response regulator transcription factor [bacterium]
MPITVMLAEDHHIIRQGLRSLLEKQNGIQVLGEAEDGRAAVRLTSELQPDVVIMDVSMPGMNGIDATRQICAENPDTQVIALSVHSDDPFVSGMILAGARGYLLKDCLLDELVKAIEAVASGRLYLSARIAQTVVQEYKSFKSRESLSLLQTLTAREREVLQLIAEGRSMKEIGGLLFISEKTAATHRQHIMEKLGTFNVPELVKIAIREGLTPLE